MQNDSGFDLPEGLELRREQDGLTLAGSGMELRQDFREMLPRVRRNRLGRELLVRAARVRSLEGAPTCMDATAGLGEDSFLLAAAGFEVTLRERVFQQSGDHRVALARALDDPDLADIAARMHVRAGDSIEALRALATPPDVVYLDPMFPERRKSAAVKKKFQLLHRLERPCEDSEGEELLAAAIAARPRKVVVKRPVKGPYLANVKPSHSVAGKAVRYDVIVPAPCC